MSDLTRLASKDKANEGQWFRVELYGEEQDFELKILGDDADAVVRYTNDFVKGVRVGKGQTADQALMLAAITNDDGGALARLAGVRATDGSELTLCGQALHDDEASYRLLLSKIPALKEFIIRKSKERSNFLG